MQRITSITLVLLWLPFSFAMSSTIDHRGCQTKCGNLTVEYPFGVGLGAGCSLSSWFDIDCTTSFNPPKAFWGGGVNEIIDITDAKIRLKLVSIASRCYNQSDHGGVVTGEKTSEYQLLKDSPYSFSSVNKLVVVGCDDASYMKSKDTGDFIRSCTALCSDSRQLSDGSCSGIGCCETSIAEGAKNFGVNLNSYGNHTSVLSFNWCGYAFVGEKGSYRFRSSDIFDDAQSFEKRIVETVPFVLDWVIPNQTCDEARKSDQYACQKNSFCVDFHALGGYRCNCTAGYEGNPYLSPGCKDINECENTPCQEKAVCTNTLGSYTCSCQNGYIGDGKKSGTGCIVNRSNKMSVYAGLSTSVGLLFLLILTYWLYKFATKRRKHNLKKKNFKRNGGLLLQQQISTNEGLVEKTRLFTVKELSKATDQFNESRIIGRGGQGTVYKGMLSDGKTVAVKKSSKLVGENQLEPFINEVVILSQLNHRNVVKLLGCCLETEVPLLVYEFIPNGTLFDHIHDLSSDFPITWDIRLRIAAEIAGALAYLHYETSLPIYHRDIKTSNILLDENYRPKVSDFGISRSIATDKTHLTTVVKGTFGYLDPEYFQSSQFTDKSDVYSFGVVLVELLSGQKPISSSEIEDGRGLARRFLDSIEQNCLHSILDHKILEQDKDGDQIIGVATLACGCLNLNGKKRPTMKEVAIELENIRRLWKKPLTVERNSERISLEMVSLALSHLDSTWTSSDGDSDVHLYTKPLIYHTV